MSRHRKKSTKGGTLTSWRQQSEQVVKKPKEINRSMGTYFLERTKGGTCQYTEEIDRGRLTHFLEMAEKGTCQDTERNRLSEEHLLPGHNKERDLSGYRNKSTDPGTLTSWRQQRELLVRTRKEIDQARHTHFLETAKGGACHETERNRLIDGHSLSGDDRRGNLSGHEKKSTEPGALTS